jgi:hypothetical protein
VQDTVPKRIAVDLGSTKQQKPFAVIEGYRADELVLAITSGASNAASNGPGQIATVDPAAIELAYWDTIKNSNNPADFKSYLDKYPDGQFAELAKSRANASRPANSSGDSVEMMYWNAIKDSHNASDFRAYITKFPNGVFVELANSRISSFEAEANARERANANIAAEDLRRNTHVFDVRDAANIEGSLTVAPGTVSFAPKKANAKKDEVIPCSDIKRVESGQSAMLPPHVNVYLGAGSGGGGRKRVVPGERQVLFYTQSGGTGLFVKTPIVNVTSDVISAITDACRMTRINK